MTDPADMAPFDPGLVRALHPGAVRHDGLSHEGATHEAFQTSTLAALLDGAYEGDVTFAELAEHGDLGLGTLQHLDGEMIAVDGEFWQARADGVLRRIEPRERTPFAVVCRFAPDASQALGPCGYEQLLAAVEEHVDATTGTVAVRVDGHFARVRARTVPAQSRPYPPLSAVAEQQIISEWRDLDATLVGFRFPDVAAGIELPGYHLHVIDAGRTRGGHVLDAELARGTLRVDRVSALRLELPAGVELPGAPGAADAAALERIERG